MITAEDAICLFCSDLKCDKSVADKLIQGLKDESLHVVHESDEKGITGIIGFNKQGWGELLWIRSDKRKTLLAGRLFNDGHIKAKLIGLEKTTIYATPERAKMYQKRGYAITHVIMEKTL